METHKKERQEEAVEIHAKGVSLRKIGNLALKNSWHGILNLICVCLLAMAPYGNNGNTRNFDIVFVFVCCNRIGGRSIFVFCVLLELRARISPFDIPNGNAYRSEIIV